MKKILILLLLLSSNAFAADNAVVVTAGTGLTLRSRDVGAGVQSLQQILGDTSGNAIYGTAGTANANILTIQGIASMTKLLVTPDSVALPANQSVNVNQMGGTSINSGCVAALNGFSASIPATVCGVFGSYVLNTNTNGQAIAANSSPVVLASNQSVADPCMFQAKTNLPISQNGTSSVQLIALSGATSIYVCSLSLVAAGATTVALTTGTGSACVTGNAAVIGTTTANIANSMSFAANGGITLGNGGGTIAKGAASSELCMILGTSVFVSGNLTYVQQ